MKDPRYQPPHSRSGRLQVVGSVREQQAGSRSIRGEFLQLRDLIDRIEELSLQTEDTQSKHASETDAIDYSADHQNGRHIVKSEEILFRSDEPVVEPEDSTTESEPDSGSDRAPADDTRDVQEEVNWSTSSEDDSEFACVPIEEDPNALQTEAPSEFDAGEFVSEVDYSVAIDLTPDVLPFDPLESLSGHGDETRPSQVHAPTRSPESNESPVLGDDLPVETPAIADDIERWWVMFKGELGLDRLALIRARLHQSPFVIDARYEEIGDGQVVLRLVTGNELTKPQLGWVVGQLIESIGLDPNCAVLSQQ